MSLSRTAIQLYCAAIKLNRRIDFRRGRSQLSPARIGVLLALENMGQASVKQLAEIEFVSHSTMSRTVAALALDGLVSSGRHRKSGVSDKRISTVRLTARGKKTSEKEIQRSLAPLEQLLSNLSARELSSLQRTIQLLNDW